MGRTGVWNTWPYFVIPTDPPVPRCWKITTWVATSRGNPRVQHGITFLLKIIRSLRIFWCQMVDSYPPHGQKDYNFDNNLKNGPKSDYAEFACNSPCCSPISYAPMENFDPSRAWYQPHWGRPASFRAFPVPLGPSEDHSPARAASRSPVAVVALQGSPHHFPGRSDPLRTGPWWLPHMGEVRWWLPKVGFRKISQQTSKSGIYTWLTFDSSQKIVICCWWFFSA